MTLIEEASEQPKGNMNSRVSRIAVASFLNLTFLPMISFIWLLLQNNSLKGSSDSVLTHHCLFAIKLNLTAAFFLIVVTVLMIYFGGFSSAWTWVYVISYFTLVHSIFILISVWAVTRAWSNKKVVFSQKS